MAGIGATSPSAGVSAKDGCPSDLAVYGRDSERRVCSAVTTVDERMEILAPGGSRTRFSQGRDLFRLSSQLDLLRDAERVVDLYAKIADCAFELCVSERVGFVLRISFLIENQRPVAHRSVLAVATGCAGR
jgi:hypothetical protein